VFLFSISQVAPGVTKNRPPNGAAPQYKSKLASNGHTQLIANKWYEGIKFAGNTSINPYFYGTYLAATKPGEPVTRTEKQAFQADAVGAAHQLAHDHFTRSHTFRVEWQPGPGGRIDWFSHGYRVNGTFVKMGDGNGKEWMHAYSILDEVLKKTMGSQIPIEPSYLIMNTAVSSTWGFPYDVPDSCEKCYDCDDPKCACAFDPGFCKMLQEDEVSLKIDSIRVYQSRDPSAHVGANHTLGCDPPDYPTKGWIEGHSSRYVRNSPFSFPDKGKPLQKIQTGGGICESDRDCGGHLQDVNLTEVYVDSESTEKRRLEKKKTEGRGKCVAASDFLGLVFGKKASAVCECNPGFRGPHCLAQENTDDTESAYANLMRESIFHAIPDVRIPSFMGILFVSLFLLLIAVNWMTVRSRKKGFVQ
jgi:hypothetical protein